MRKLDSQDKEIVIYRDELALGKIKMESKINDMFHNQNNKIKDTTQEIHDTMIEMDKLKVFQENIGK
jgi:hypothetical protein